MSKFLAFEKDLQLISDFMDVWHQYIRNTSGTYLSLFSPKEVEVLASFGRKRMLTRGQVIFNQGDPARSLALLLKGKLNVYVAPEPGPDGQAQKPVKVNSIKIGETVGEMALITDGKGGIEGKRNATVRSEGESTVIVFDYNDFAAFIFGELPEKRADLIRTRMRDMVVDRLYPKVAKPWQVGAMSPEQRRKKERREADASRSKDSSAALLSLSRSLNESSILPEADGDENQQPDRSQELERTVSDPEADPEKKSPTKAMGLGSLFGGAALPELDPNLAELKARERDRKLLEDETLSNASSRLKKQPKIDPDNPWNCPITIINQDALLECLWLAKFGEKEMTKEAKEVSADVIQVPHTAVFHDGELVQWYFGSGNSMKKRSKERMVAWALIEEFCGKGASQSTDTVATLTTWKPGRDRESEYVQCRLLDKKRLESVVSGAKTNRLNGVLQKYVYSGQGGEEDEHVLHCLWTSNSCSIESVPEFMLECFTETHKPARILPNKKQLRARMLVKFHHYVPGQLSMFGDHLTSTTVLSRPLLTSHVAEASKRVADKLSGVKQPPLKARNAAFGPRRSMSADMYQQRPIPLLTRESVKMACQRIASSLQRRVNSSKNAQRKAELMKSLDNSEHDIYFSQVQSMSCLFKIRGGQPYLVHCDVAMSHPDTKPSLSMTALHELKNPTQEKFAFYCQFGITENRLSAQGARASTMDFTEFSRYLAAAELLYKHISLTEASWVFSQALKDVAPMPGDGDREMLFDTFRKAVWIIADML
eukprot:CAMPEP_0114128728 /NCGR_PEP_ID=MMETSP0043_2-20121206/11090_1 /TAXON_ID=464988 /ORGANISM="Hemiselmis andersenii, Strain CCMP644" /LENGTH=767 /DNA_ID=CAMNT_0001221943 /DNA_START=78 /DNA_END=2378 /DNA_ORIENTATION=-